MKAVFDLWLGVLNRKVEPVVVAVCIGVILDKQRVGVGLFLVFEGAE